MNDIKYHLAPAILLIWLVATQAALAATVPDAWLEEKLAQEQATSPLTEQDVNLLKRSAQMAIRSVQQRTLASARSIIAYVDVFVRAQDTATAPDMRAQLSRSAPGLIVAMRSNASQTGSRR